MTPIMYAVLGRGYNDSNIITEFRNISNIGQKNCLGHTAYDILRCIADNDIQRKNISLLMPLSRTITKAGGMLGAIGASTAAIAGVTLFSVLTKTKQDCSGISSDLSALNSRAFASDGSAARLKDYQLNTKKKILSIYNRISEIENECETVENKIKYLVNSESIKREVLDEWDNTVILERKHQYLSERAQNYREIVNSAPPKDEFETSDEYNNRIHNLFIETYGVEKSCEELSELNDLDIEEISQRITAITDTRVHEQEQRIQMLRSEEKRLKLQIELVKIYIFAPGVRAVLGNYDADTETFEVLVTRFKLKLRVPRETARLMRDNISDCKIRFIRHDDIDDNWIQMQCSFRDAEYVTNKLENLILPLICESL